MEPELVILILIDELLQTPPEEKVSSLSRLSKLKSENFNQPWQGPEVACTAHVGSANTTSNIERRLYFTLVLRL